MPDGASARVIKVINTEVGQILVIDAVLPPQQGVPRDVPEDKPPPQQGDPRGAPEDEQPPQQGNPRGTPEDELPPQQGDPRDSAPEDDVAVEDEDAAAVAPVGRCKLDPGLKAPAFKV